MARPIVIEKTDTQTEIPKRCLLLFAWERRALKATASANGYSMTDVILNLMDDFMERVETEGATNVLYKYVGADLVESENRKKLQTQVFRCDNERFFKFTRYCLAVGDSPSTFLRKLVREYLGEPMAEFSPKQLEEELKNIK